MDHAFRTVSVGKSQGGLSAPTATRLSIATAVLWSVVVVSVLLGSAHAVNPGGRAAIEATITLVAIFTAGLFAANFQRSRGLTDLLGLYGLVAVSLADFIYSAAPALTGHGGLESGGNARIACEVIVALAFAAAAFSPGQTIPDARRGRVAVVTLAGAGGIMVAELISQLVGSKSAASMLNDGGMAAAAHHPVALAFQLGSAAALVAAGIAFLRRTGRAEPTCWALAGASFLLAGARLHSVTAPAVAVDWVTPREGLRLAAYALLLAGGYWQYAGTRRETAHAALSSERERIARDLHDGLAQDLACIAAQGQRLGSELGSEHPLMVATRHAVATSRGAIADLAASTAPTTEAALRLIAGDLEHRFDVRVNVRVEADTTPSGDHDLDPVQRDHLMRIAREAIVNAALHGVADHIDVVLRRHHGELIMQVSDDGRGIGAGSAPGLGLRTMHARAAAMGGQLKARNRVGGGTELKLVISDGCGSSR